LKVQRDGRPVTVTVTADGTDATVSHVGAALLSDTADRLGMTAALARELTMLRQRRGGHDPGRVVRDLAVTLADGGDALCDLRTLRDQPALFSSVASDATAWRVIDGIAEHGLLDGLRETVRPSVCEAGAGCLECPRFLGHVSAGSVRVRLEDPHRVRQQGRRPYPPEFKREAVELYRRSDKSIAVVASELGIATESLRAWNKQHAVDAGEREGLKHARA
jgi:hypothetical protein